MLLKELTAAPTTPVSLADIKAHLRLGHGFADDGAQDALLERILRNATAVVERRTRQALIARPYLVQTARWDRDGHLHLSVGPIVRIDAIRFVMLGSVIALEAEDWLLEPGTMRQRLTGPAGGPLWPMPHGAVAELDFTAGYGASPEDVPDDLRQAVTLLAAHYYENRFGDVELEGGLPFGVQSIVETHRPVRL